MHYIESRTTESGRTHHVVRLEADEYLGVVLNRARSGATISELADELRQTFDDPEVSEDEINEYLTELIDNQVLVSNLIPLVSGDSALEDLIRQLELLPAGHAASSILTRVRDKMKVIDLAGPGVPPSEYQNIAAELRRLPAEFDIGRLFQVDLIKPMRYGVISNDVVEELKNGVEVLCRVGRTLEMEELRQFRESFIARYDVRGCLFCRPWTRKLVSDLVELRNPMAHHYSVVWVFGIPEALRQRVLMICKPLYYVSSCLPRKTHLWSRILACLTFQNRIPIRFASRFVCVDRYFGGVFGRCSK